MRSSLDIKLEKPKISQGALKAEYEILENSTSSEEDQPEVLDAIRYYLRSLKCKNPFTDLATLKEGGFHLHRKGKRHKGGK